MPICLSPLFLLPPNPPLPSLPSSFYPFLNSSMLPFLLFYSFILPSGLILKPSLYPSPSPSIHTCSTSPHLSITQLLVLSLWGAFACFSKVIFPAFERFHFKKLSIRFSSGKKMSHLEAQMSTLCFKCYISTENIIKFVVRWDFNLILKTCSLLISLFAGIFIFVLTYRKLYWKCAGLWHVIMGLCIIPGINGCSWLWLNLKEQNRNAPILYGSGISHDVTRNFILHKK